MHSGFAVRLRFQPVVYHRFHIRIRFFLLRKPTVEMSRFTSDQQVKIQIILLGQGKGKLILLRATAKTSETKQNNENTCVFHTFKNRLYLLLWVCILNRNINSVPTVIICFSQTNSGRSQKNRYFSAALPSVPLRQTLAAQSVYC